MNRGLNPGWNRRILLLSACAAALAATGCGSLNLSKPASGAWSGRLSLRIDSQPVQTFSALFELHGTPQAGELMLTSPIGSTLAQLRWSQGKAVLKSGSETRQHHSIDALIKAATGAAIPIDALFNWLAGREDGVFGWQPDLSQIGSGRLQAIRTSPEPRAELRVVFEHE